MKKSTLEFWFEYGSTYTYLSVMRIEALAHKHAVEITWKPFLLMPILDEQGMREGPFLPYPNKLRYMWRDLERRAQKHQLPYNKPSTYPPNTLLTARVGLLAARQGWCNDFTRHVFQHHWIDDIEIGTEKNLAKSISEGGRDPSSVLKEATSDNNKIALRDETEAAKEIGIFGSPTFVVEREIFWGDDRLEDAIEWCSMANSG